MRVVVLVVGLAGPALAQTADPALEQVIGRLRSVLVGLLVGLATLFLTVGGLREQSKRKQKSCSD